MYPVLTCVVRSLSMFTFQYTKGRLSVVPALRCFYDSLRCGAYGTFAVQYHEFELGAISMMGLYMFM